jgi:hypothetical protein
MMLRKKFHTALLLALALTLAACGGGKMLTEEELMTDDERRKARVGKLFGEDSFVFGPGSRRGDESGTGSGIAVNGYLWRASLDTMSFMPLTSADPFGGIIVTDWYVPPESPNERFKVQVYILDRQLRADGLRVTVFRQVRAGAGNWVSAETKPETAAELENAILTRARQLRIDSGGAL